MAADTSAPDAAGEVRVWDPLVRVFHWTLAASFLGAQLWEDPRVLHETLGWIAGGAVAVRLVWGLIGSRHARFADFVPGPSGLLGYVRDVAAGRERRYLGHNPAGGDGGGAAGHRAGPGRHRLDDGPRRLLGWAGWRRPTRRWRIWDFSLWRCISRA